jgi:hypothetical protein
MKTTILFTVMALGLSTSLLKGAYDGEQVYKNNCNRCHITIRTYSEKMSRSIVRHMRIKALLTRPEAEAVLAYLVENAGPSAGSRTKRDER